MKVFFDYSVFTLQRYGGASNYIVNLAENFSDQINPFIVSLFHQNYYLKISKIKYKGIYYDKVPFLTKYLNKINKMFFDYKLKKNLPEIIHFTYFNEKNFYSTNAKKVITEYDLIKEKFYKENYKDQIEYKKKIFDKVDQIICISENTKKDLEEYYKIDKSKISVIYLATNKDKSFRSKHLNIRPYILYVGSRGRYKNFYNAIKAYSKSEKIISHFDFVCFGGGAFSQKEKDLFKDLKIDPKNIHHFSGDKLDLNYFYHKARVFIFPSMYEGFGIPLLEAMNMDCPVICSNTSSFPEVVNDSAIFIDPKSIESIKSEMEKLVFDDQLLLKLKKKGNDNLEKYSWKKCAQETEKLYKNII